MKNGQISETEIKELFYPKIIILYLPLNFTTIFFEEHVVELIILHFLLFYKNVKTLA